MTRDDSGFSGTYCNTKNGELVVSRHRLNTYDNLNFHNMRPRHNCSINLSQSGFITAGINDETYSATKYVSDP